MLLQQRGTAAGQDLPGADDASTTSATTATQPTSDLSAAQFASDTLSSLLSTQEAPPTSSDIAAKVIGAADTNGDGSLSLEEVEQALGQDTTPGADALGQAFAKLDTNGDGQISDSELTSALDAKQAAGGPQQAQHAHHGHHAHHAGASSSDMASQMLTDLDTDGDGELSADEIQAGVKQGSSDSLASALGSLDTDGDGKLSASELSSAIDAFRAAHHHGGANAAAQTAQAVTA